MLFRHSENLFFCDPKITTFFRIKLSVFDFLLSYSDLALIAIQAMRLLTLHALEFKNEHLFKGNGLLRLLAHCEPLFAQLESVNKCYLRLRHVLLAIHNRAGG